MNYYERHLGDYARDAGHLSQAEHGAYNLLLDRYYATEQPIPAAVVYAVGRATKAAERAVVDRVLAQFFRLENGGWRHKRVEEEIVKVHAKSQKARDAAAKRWHSDGNANASAEHGGRISETHPLQSPDTSNQPPKKKKEARAPETDVPENFGISERVRAWALEKGYGHLEAHLENFIGQCRAKSYRYADWDAAFMNAIRKDWAELRSGRNGSTTNRRNPSLAEQAADAERRADETLGPL